MSYTEIEVGFDSGNIPKAVQAIFDDVDSVIDSFDDVKGNNKRYPLMIPSSPVQQYRAMKDLTTRGIVQGDVFCEWGSGFGFGVCLAELLGYESYGIELETIAVEIGEKLVARHKLNAQIIQTDFFPDGFEAYAEVGGDQLIPPPDYIENESTYQYEEMDRALDEVDLFYVYPWPSKWELMIQLFDHVAGEGAILLANYGDNEMCAYQKD